LGKSGEARADLLEKQDVAWYPRVGLLVVNERVQVLTSMFDQESENLKTRLPASNSVDFERRVD
jgi:hypothetical protein